MDIDWGWWSGTSTKVGRWYGRGKMTPILKLLTFGMSGGGEGGISCSGGMMRQQI